jgi:nuclear transport factor 2 (NTF2) superfamily protein
VLNPSNIKPGEEQSEKYYSYFSKSDRFQYDYRDLNGKLYSACGKTLEEAKEKALESKRKHDNYKRNKI